jgi:hypothetical protein
MYLYFVDIYFAVGTLTSYKSMDLHGLLQSFIFHS